MSAITSIMFQCYVKCHYKINIIPSWTIYQVLCWIEFKKSRERVENDNRERDGDKLTTDIVFLSQVGSWWNADKDVTVLFLNWAPRHEGVLGSGSIAPLILWHRHQMVVSGQLHTPTALPPGKEPLVPIGEEAGWASEPFWMRWWKFPAPTRNRTLQSQLSNP
jgi:hypothetical protein